MRDVHHEVQATAEKARTKQKAMYDKHASDCILQSGDKVLVANKSQRGKAKLKDRWEADSYVIVRKQQGIPVYVVRQVGSPNTRTLHRNMLMLCPFDVASAPDTSDSGGQSRDGTQPRPEGLPSTGGGTEDGLSCDSARAGSPSQSEYEGDDYDDDSADIDHGQRRRGRLLLPRFHRKGQPITPPLEGPGTSASTRDNDSASEEGLPRRRPQQRRRPPQRFEVWK